MSRMKNTRYESIILLGIICLGITYSARAEEASVLFRFSGILGQSQPPQCKPVPFIGSEGVVSDTEGGIWSGSRDEIVRFTRKEDGSWVVSENFKIGMWIRPGMGLQWDGQRIFFGGEDRNIYAFDPKERGASIKIKTAAVGSDKTISFVVTPLGLTKGYGRKGKIFILEDDQIKAFGGDGTDRGIVLTLTRPAGVQWYYCAIGIEPMTGDLLVASEYPDYAIYRFDSLGREMIKEGWPRKHFAGNIVSFADKAWAVGHGDAVSLPLVLKQGTEFAVQGQWASPARGLTQDVSGEYFLACSQGLVQFDLKGHPKNSRIGGLSGVRNMAVSPDGTLIAGVEGGQRLIRLSIDDKPDTPLCCDNHEPWRAGNGWQSRVSSIEWDQKKFLVLDEVEGRLWYFDPWHTGWKETPWIPLTLPKVFTNPRSLAIGNIYMWVLDDTGLTMIDRRNFKWIQKVELSGMGDMKNVRCLTAKGDEEIILVTDSKVVACVRQNEASYQVLWQNTEISKEVTAMVVVENVLAVVDGTKSQIALLNTLTGRLIGKITQEAVPGGMVPTTVSASGRWLFVFDAAGYRILRFKLIKEERAMLKGTS